MAVYVIGPSKQTSSSTETLRRVTKREHCPICNDSDWCEIRSDGAVHCMRTESDRPCEVRMGGWWHNLPTSNAHPVVRTTPTPKPPTPPLAPADQRNAVYQALLDACQLSAPHEAYLLGCGLAQSMPASYATLNGNRDAVAAHLQRTFSGDVLAGVPGLFLHPAGTLGIASSDGLLLAVRDTSGRVTRLQSRCESGDGSKVYRWLSSSNHGGPSSGAVAHYADGPDKRWLWITEGVKKAEVLAQQTGQPAIGLPGHGALTAGLALLDEAIKQFDFAGAKLAFDEDSDEDIRAAVDKSRQAWITAVAERDLAVRVARWPNAEGKGIDDLLLGGHSPTLTTPPAGAAGDSPADAIKARMCDDLVTILSSGVPAAERLALAALRITQDDAPKELKPTALSRIAPFAGAHSKSQIQALGKTLCDAANRMRGLRRRAERDALQRTHLSFSLDVSDLPTATEIVAPSPRRAAHAQKQRERVACRHCGRTGLFVTCPHCGVQEPIEAALQSGTGSAVHYRSDAPLPAEHAGSALPIEHEGMDTTGSADHSPLVIGSAFHYRSAPTQRECTALLEHPVIKDGWRCRQCGGDEGEPNSTGTWRKCTSCGFSTRADSVWRDL